MASDDFKVAGTAEGHALWHICDMSTTSRTLARRGVQEIHGIVDQAAALVLR